MAKDGAPRFSSSTIARRIVVVDDDEDTRELMRLLLEGRGHSVFEARDAQTAIARIKELHPDLALIDVGLPVIDGYQVARTLREDEGLQDVTLVAFTGYCAPSDVTAALEAGFDSHLKKPVDLERLDALLRNASRQSTACKLGWRTFDAMRSAQSPRSS